MKSIVLKLFLLTTMVCLLTVAIIFVGQTVFFKQFYAHQKIQDVQSAIQAYVEDERKAGDNPQALAELEQDFYRQHNTWIATLDAQGRLKFTDDFLMEIRLDQAEGFDLADAVLTVPLYSVMNAEDFYSDRPFPQPWVQEGEEITIEGIMIHGQPIPQRMGRDVSNLRSENRLENSQMVNKEFEILHNRYHSNGTKYREAYPGFLVQGTITQLRTPEGAAAARYANRLFMDRILAFQADLLYGDFDPSPGPHPVMDFSENQVNYKIFVERSQDGEGNAEYVFAMTSLQPVNEAVGMLEQYYVYVIIATILLVMLVSFYYSRRISRPLLRMNRVTRQMAGLDFSEDLPITSKDEIGSLSRSINELSGRLHAHILRLEEDIEKEKQLERTRKEFISSVSHELKTPLSVIQSCLAILKDGIAPHKRDYYFQAMEDEVSRMDMLIADMLELAKYESGTYKMNMDSFSIDAVIERTCVKLADELAAKQLHLHTSLPPVEVMGNELRIEQVIVNFLTNAIRYTPEQQAIHITISKETDSARISIENKGARIPDEQLERIWDRFYRGEQSRGRATGGTGLGLAISKKILEMHGVPYGAVNTDDGVLFYFHLRTKT
ncbi:cell wall metabolism sensor histidine kinase WalK [Paenibacillus sp. 7541]|uniref:sensor histidine kinase n=1 Tax=Paenibacillus sp. 7541 TaxID=2026236 RepID=UPI000BA6CF86|nr:HAMP domain-containing sensor histidine kinase [Paenibacillus sp. 7541]PAK54994.1 two-component sensor histidine kinase [Paenibacillus sp. 7541]